MRIRLLSPIIVYSYIHNMHKVIVIIHYIHMNCAHRCDLRVGVECVCVIVWNSALKMHT